MSLSAIAAINERWVERPLVTMTQPIFSLAPQNFHRFEVAVRVKSVGCPVFDVAPDFEIVWRSYAVAHILKEVTLITAILTEPGIGDRLCSRRRGFRLGGGRQYDVHIRRSAVGRLWPDDIKTAVSFYDRQTFRSDRPKMSAPGRRQRVAGFTASKQRTDATPSASECART